MSLKPTLVFDDEMKICMQLRLGAFTATLRLPEEMSTWNELQLQPFFDRVVPEMTKNLIAMRNDDNRKQRKKACAKSSIGLSPPSDVETLPQPRRI